MVVFLPFYLYEYHSRNNLTRARFNKTSAKQRSMFPKTFIALLQCFPSFAIWESRIRACERLQILASTGKREVARSSSKGQILWALLNKCNHSPALAKAGGTYINIDSLITKWLEKRASLTSSTMICLSVCLSVYPSQLSHYGSFLQWNGIETSFTFEEKWCDD